MSKFLTSAVLERAVQIDPQLWTQISRTVDGHPVDVAQIRMILEAIAAALSLEPTDDLVDIGCGNGALDFILSPLCRSILAIDPDMRLLDRAKLEFGSESGLEFARGRLPDRLPPTANPDLFTKALIYGAFAYFPEPRMSLQAIREYFPNVRTLFIGQIPDAERKSAFTDRVRSPKRLLQLESAIGRWFSQSDFVALAKGAGWSVKISTMPTTFYAAHYRFDALLGRD